MVSINNKKIPLDCTIKVLEYRIIACVHDSLHIFAALCSALYVQNRSGVVVLSWAGQVDHCLNCHCNLQYE